MKTEEILRLQAYLDNEVSSSEARQIAAWIARDAEAKALYEELAATKAVLIAENEAPMAVPESRDFYWSKIARQIERAEREPARPTPARPLWLRLFAPVAGAALLAVFVFASVSFNNTPRLQQSASSGPDLTEKAHLENGSITFRSAGMTLTWISSGEEAAVVEETPTDNPSKGLEINDDGF
jgi:anti-sigma factor RsiW